MSKQVHTQFTVPLYGAVVYVVVSKDICKARKKYNKLFGGILDGDCAALCSYSSNGNFGLFFDSNALTLTKVAHEVFHLTHRIMDWAGCNFDPAHHEQGALLHGWLMNKVNSIIRQTDTH